MHCAPSAISWWAQHYLAPAPEWTFSLRTVLIVKWEKRTKKCTVCRWDYNGCEKTMKVSDGEMKMVFAAGQDVSLSNTCQWLISVKVVMVPQPTLSPFEDNSISVNPPPSCSSQDTQTNNEKVLKFVCFFFSDEVKGLRAEDTITVETWRPSGANGGIDLIWFNPALDQIKKK